MKKVRLFLTLTLIIVLAVPTVVRAEDHQKIEREDKIGFLRSIGTSEEALSNYNSKQIDDLYTTLYGKDVEFSGCGTQIVEIEDGNTNLRGNIPTSKLKLNVATYDMKTNGVVTGVDVSLGFEWLTPPFWNFTDGFTFTWDNNIFYDAGFYAVSGVDTDKGYRVIDTIDAPATAAAGGMGWYLSINNPLDANTVGGHYGGAQVLLRPRAPFAPGANLDSKMYFTYAHQLVGGGISFQPGSVGVSITGGNYDQQTYSYTYH